MGPLSYMRSIVDRTSLCGAYLYIKTLVLNAGKPDSVLFVRLRER